jgi:hypothetical protein
MSITTARTVAISPTYLLNYEHQGPVWLNATVLSTTESTNLLRLYREVPVANISGANQPAWLRVQVATTVDASGHATHLLTALGVDDATLWDWLKDGNRRDVNATVNGSAINYSVLLASLFNTALTRVGEEERVKSGNIDGGGAPGEPIALQALLDIFSTNQNDFDTIGSDTTSSHYNALKQYSYAVLLAIQLNNAGYFQTGATSPSATNIYLNERLFKENPVTETRTVDIILKEGACLEFPLSYKFTADSGSAVADTTVAICIKVTGA